MPADRRVALVTGASQGIGRAIAQVMARSGWRVVLASRNREGLAQTAAAIEADGGQAEARTLDVSVESDVTRLARDLADAGMSPEVLVNNSGVGGPSKPLWEVEVEEWDETIAVNLRGVYLCCRAFMPTMVEKRRGVVINIGSITGKNPLLNRAPYAASKAALIGLTRTLAADSGPHGVRVNLVSPGAVGGSRLDWVIQARAEAMGRSEGEVRVELSATSALRRFTEPTEVAHAVDFLASDAASGITGIDLSVAAGYVMN